VAEGYVLSDGEGLCRMVITKHEKAEWISAENIIKSNRGEGEFGHTRNE
jgi:dUTP pyrophosphatase